MTFNGQNHDLSDSSVEVIVASNTLHECIIGANRSFELFKKGIEILIFEFLKEVLQVFEVFPIELLSINGSVDDGDDILDVAPPFSDKHIIGSFSGGVPSLEVLIFSKFVPHLADVDELGLLILLIITIFILIVTIDFVILSVGEGGEKHESGSGFVDLHSLLVF